METTIALWRGRGGKDLNGWKWIPAERESKVKNVEIWDRTFCIPLQKLNLPMIIYKISVSRLKQIECRTNWGQLPE